MSQLGCDTIGYKCATSAILSQVYEAWTDGGRGGRGGPREASAVAKAMADELRMTAGGANAGKGGTATPTQESG